MFLGYNPVEPLPGERPTFQLQYLLGWDWNPICGKYELSGSNFIYLHYGYFIIVSVFSSAILWAVDTPATPDRRLAYVDALFLAVSAQSLTGLNTVGSASSQKLAWIVRAPGLQSCILRHGG